MNNKIKSNCCDCVIISPTPTRTPRPTATPTKTPKPTVSSSRKLKVPTPTPTTSLRATVTPTTTLRATVTPTTTLRATVTPTTTLRATTTPTTTLRATTTPTTTLRATTTPTATPTPTIAKFLCDNSWNGFPSESIGGGMIVGQTSGAIWGKLVAVKKTGLQAFRKDSNITQDPKTNGLNFIIGEIISVSVEDVFLSSQIFRGVPGTYIITNITNEAYVGGNYETLYVSCLDAQTPIQTQTPTSTLQRTPTPTATKRPKSSGGSAFPASPFNLSAIEGNQAIDFIWDAPTNPRSGDLFYVVGHRQTTGSAWMYNVYSISSERRAVISALINDKEYEIKVGTCTGGSTAQIAAAIWSVSIYATPVATQIIAAMPTGLDAIEGNQAIDLSWDAPTNPRSGDLFYVVAHKETQSEFSTWIYSIYPISEKRAIISSLINGKEYDIKVGTCTGGSTAQIAAAVWSISIRVMPNIPAVIEQIPSGLVAVADDTIIDFSWDAPINPRSEDTLYLIAYREKGLVSWTYKTIDITSATNQVISSLTNGIEYEIRVGVSRGGSSMLTGAIWSIIITARPLGPLSAPVVQKVTGEVNNKWNRYGAFYQSFILGSDGTSVDVPATNRSKIPKFFGYVVWQTSAIEVKILSNGNESSYQINLENSSSGTRSWQWTSPVLSEGSHIFKFFALDIKGNKSLALEYNYTVDTTIPIIPTILGKNDIGGYGKRIIFGTAEPNTWVLVQIVNNIRAQDFGSGVEGVPWGSVPSAKQALYLQFLGNGVSSFPEYRIDVGADGKWSWTYPETFTLIDGSRTLFPPDGIFKNIRHPENPEFKFCSMDYAGNESDWLRTNFGGLVNLSPP